MMKQLILLCLCCVAVYGLGDIYEQEKPSRDRKAAERTGDDNSWLTPTRKPKRYPDNYERKMRLREERRQMRQDRREERRKNRHHNNDAKLKHHHPIKYEDKVEQSSQEQEFYPDRPTKYGSRGRHNIEPHLDFSWLARNLSSIWQVLNRMQQDMKQIRRQYRQNSADSRKDGQKYQEKEEETSASTVICDEELLSFSGRKNCIDEKGLVCGGHGKCECGQCICNALFYGVQCQCNDQVCKYDNGKMCGGPDQGQCRCGQCLCRLGFTGSACECSTKIAECENSDTGLLCSSNGDCKCNRCHCKDGYHGKYCEESIYSASICENLKLCVLCEAYKKNFPQCEDCNIDVSLVDELEPSRETCVMIHSDCVMKYAYVHSANEGSKTKVLVQRDRACGNHH